MQAQAGGDSEIISHRVAMSALGNVWKARKTFRAKYVTERQHFKLAKSGAFRSPNYAKKFPFRWKDCLTELAAIVVYRVCLPHSLFGVIALLIGLCELVKTGVAFSLRGGALRINLTWLVLLIPILIGSTYFDLYDIINSQLGFLGTKSIGPPEPQLLPFAVVLMAFISEFVSVYNRMRLFTKARNSGLLSPCTPREKA